MIQPTDQVLLIIVRFDVCERYGEVRPFRSCRTSLIRWRFAVRYFGCCSSAAGRTDVRSSVCIVNLRLWCFSFPGRRRQPNTQWR